MARGRTGKRLKSPMEAERKKVPISVVREVDAESGYRCGNPRCLTLVAIEYHHIEYVSEGGKNEAWNLLPLCPTCHARHHSGEIALEAIRIWKGLLVTLNNGFDRHARDLLLYLWHTRNRDIWYSGDGALQFAGLIAAGLVWLHSQPLQMKNPSSPFAGKAQEHARVSDRLTIRPWTAGPVSDSSLVGLKVSIRLTEKGALLVGAWVAGDEERFKAALSMTSAFSPS